MERAISLLKSRKAAIKLELSYCEPQNVYFETAIKSLNDEMEHINKVLDLIKLNE